MLVLSRRKSESILIGTNGDVKITFLGLDGKGRVRLAIDAPREVKILRGELAPPSEAPAPIAPPVPTSADSGRRDREKTTSATPEPAP